MIKGRAMNLRKIKFFTLYILFIQAIQISAFHQLERDFLKFEQLLLTNNNIIEFPAARPEQHTIATVATNRNSLDLKPWTFMVYMAADNDLRAFAANNIKQMASIGSNDNINIVAHLDIRLNDNQKVTRRFYIDNNKIIQMNHDAATQRMDSGDPQTLISFCAWAIKAFPAQNYALILWNHGTGVLDPKYYKI